MIALWTLRLLLGIVAASIIVIALAIVREVKDEDKG